MFRSTALLLILSLTLLPVGVATAEDDPYFESVKVDDIIFANYPGPGQHWQLAIRPKDSSVDKNSNAYYKVRKVTKQAILVRQFNYKVERWIPWSAVMDVHYEVKD